MISKHTFNPLSLAEFRGKIFTRKQFDEQRKNLRKILLQRTKMRGLGCQVPRGCL